MDREAVFAGDTSTFGAEGYITDHASAKEDHLGRVEIDRALKSFHKMLEHGFLEAGGEVGDKLLR